ncbi:MAG: phytochelatin synthase family protein, partial [Burkholderiales bacterium]
MRLLARLVLACCMAASFVPAALARNEAPAATAQTLVPFSSEEGLARLARSGAKVDFPALANQFEAQSNGAFCGPTTTAIVLNTV